MRALVIAHGHPDLGAGGGEVAAYGLFRALKRRGDVEASFLARSADLRMPPNAVGRLRENEYLIRRDLQDWLMLSATPDAAPVGKDLASFLRTIRPDVVFLHHYVHLGLETLAEIRAVVPNSRIVLTLHDFMGICANGGLMMKRSTGEGPCGAAGPVACHGCFPDHGPGFFERRAQRMAAHFSLVDRFVAPSRFLRDRYIAWGLPPECIAVIENGVEDVEEVAGRAMDGTIRLGFFGQIRRAKGLHVLLAALHHLTQTERQRLRLDVNGSRLDAEAPWYRELILRLRGALEREGVLCWKGAYAREALAGRLAEVDCLVVPSVWWENSPLVIQEAFAAGRPVIGSRIGGVAEKVQDGIDGALFEMGNVRELAALLRQLLADGTLLQKWRAGIRAPVSSDTAAKAYLDLFVDAEGRTAAYR